MYLFSFPIYSIPRVKLLDQMSDFLTKTFTLSWSQSFAQIPERFPVYAKPKLILLSDHTFSNCFSFLIIHRFKFLNLLHKIFRKHNVLRWLSHHTTPPVNLDCGSGGYNQDWLEGCWDAKTIVNTQCFRKILRLTEDRFKIDYRFYVGQS